jgi:hypothetical protein
VSRALGNTIFAISLAEFQLHCTHFTTGVAKGEEKEEMYKWK